MLRVCPQLILFQVKKWPNKCKKQIVQTSWLNIVQYKHANGKVSQEHLWDRETLKGIIYTLFYISIYSIALKIITLPHKIHCTYKMLHRKQTNQ